MRHPSAVYDSRSWIAASIALLLVILALSIWLPPRLQVLSRRATHAQSPTDSTLLDLSPADAARRAAIAKLGPIIPLPGVDAVDSYSRAMALYNRLTAGIALEQGNQSQFQSILDPVSGQPFAVTQTSNGFQLSSPVESPAGGPVTLTFGPPPRN